MRAPLALLAALLAGCAHVETHRVLFQPEAAHEPGGADLYIQSVPSRPFVEVGLVQAIHHGGDSESGALAALRAEARRMGCDAVARAHAQVGASASHASGVCVRWADQPQTPR